MSYMIERLEILKKRYDDLNEKLLDPANLSSACTACFPATAFFK